MNRDLIGGNGGVMETPPPMSVNSLFMGIEYLRLIGYHRTFNS